MSSTCATPQDYRRLLLPRRGDRRRGRTTGHRAPTSDSASTTRPSAGLNPGVIVCSMHGYGSDGPYGPQTAYDDVIQAVSGLAATPRPAAGDPQFVRSPVSRQGDGAARRARHLRGARRACPVGSRAGGRGPDVRDHGPVPAGRAAGRLRLRPAPSARRSTPGTPTHPSAAPTARATGWWACCPTPTRTGGRCSRRSPRRSAPPTRASPPSPVAAGTSTSSTSGWTGCLATLTTDEALDLCRSAQVPIAPVNGVADLFDDPHLDAVDFFPRREHPRLGTVRQARSPVRFSRSGSAPSTHAPELDSPSRSGGRAGPP